MPIRIGFRFRLLPFVATVLLVALGISLGQWQERRAAQKIALEAKLLFGNRAAPLVLGPQILAAEGLQFRRVSIKGRFVPAWTLYLENRPYQGRAGFYVLEPFQIDGSDMHVLIERGWLPRNSEVRERLPAYTTPPGTVILEGSVRLNAGRVMQLGSPPPLKPAAIVQNVDIAQLAAASGMRLQPFVVQETAVRNMAQNTPADGAPIHAESPVPGQSADHLVRDWPLPSLGVEQHRAYAFQWYALALMAFLFFVLTGLRRGKN